MFKLLTLLLAVSSWAHSARNCNQMEEEIYFVGNPEDFKAIQNCSYLNSSLFITGDYNIINLEPLSNLKEIDGYLVILDSHLIRNLKGLHNLEKIKGSQLYLKSSASTFKYNNNFLDDENRGLCYANLVDWSLITDFEVVDTNNGINCPVECHPECLGCFGPGPRLCQACKNHKVGDTCVGYDCDTFDCSLMDPSKKLDLNLDRIAIQDINVSWEALNITEAGGVIQKYQLFRDGGIIYETYFNDSGYTTLEKLDTHYLDSDLVLDNIYNYQIEYTTESGSILGDNFELNLYDWRPDDITDLELVGFTLESNLITKIKFKSDTYLPPFGFQYQLSGSTDFLNLNSLSSGSQHSSTLLDLNYDTNYLLTVCGYNLEFDIVGNCDILEIITPPRPTTTTNTFTSTTLTTSTTSTNTLTTSTLTTSTLTTSSSLTSSTTLTTNTLTTNTLTTNTLTTTLSTTTPTITTSTTITTRTLTTSSSLTSSSTLMYTSSLTNTSTFVNPSQTETTPTTSQRVKNISYLDILNYSGSSGSGSGSGSESGSESGSSLEPIAENVKDSEDEFDYLILIWILVSLIVLILCLCMLCYFKKNEIAPEVCVQTSSAVERPKISFPNPVFEDRKVNGKDFLYDSMNSNQEFTLQKNKTIKANNINQRSQNPIYVSGSSTSSDEDIQERNGRMCQNQTYGFPQDDIRPVPARVIPNGVYQLPQDPLDRTYDSASFPTVTENELYDYALEITEENCIPPNVVNNDKEGTDEYIIVTDNSERVVLNSQELDEVRRNLKQQQEVSTVELTDESIGRRKGSVMNELKLKLESKTGNLLSI